MTTPLPSGTGLRPLTPTPHSIPAAQNEHLRKQIS
jgi:hypothetical protein